MLSVGGRRLEVREEDMRTIRVISAIREIVDCGPSVSKGLKLKAFFEVTGTLVKGTWITERERFFTTSSGNNQFLDL